MNAIKRWIKNRLDRWKRRRYLDAMPSHLAQDLEIIANALRAGSSFVQAVQIVAQEGAGPLAQDWLLLLNELQRGAGMTQALAHWEARCPIAPVKTIATLVGVIQGTGGNLAESLLSIAEALRLETTFQGKVRALTAQGKLSGYVVGAMPFLILAALAGLAPELIRPLFVTVLGWVMLAVIVILVAIGTYLIEKIVTIEV